GPTLKFADTLSEQLSENNRPDLQGRGPTDHSVQCDLQGAAVVAGRSVPMRSVRIAGPSSVSTDSGWNWTPAYAGPRSAWMNPSWSAATSTPYTEDAIAVNVE